MLDYDAHTNRAPLETLEPSSDQPSHCAPRALEADFDHQLRRLRQEPDGHEIVKPTRVRNILVAYRPGIAQVKPAALGRQLRVTVEEFGQDGTVAYLVSDRTFTGFGANVGEAVRELRELIRHDFAFYESTPDDQLTADARESKAMLRKLFVEPR